MGRREKSEEYRLEMIRHLKEKYQQAKPSEVLEAEKVIARYRESEARDRGAMARLRLQLPNENLCPECFYMHERESILHTIGSESGVDRFRCRECGYEIETTPRL